MFHYLSTVRQRAQKRDHNHTDYQGLHYYTKVSVCCCSCCLWSLCYWFVVVVVVCYCVVGRIDMLFVFFLFVLLCCLSVGCWIVVCWLLFVCWVVIRLFVIVDCCFVCWYMVCAMFIVGVFYVLWTVVWTMCYYTSAIFHFVVYLWLFVVVLLMSSLRCGLLLSCLSVLCCYWVYAIDLVKIDEVHQLRIAVVSF